MLNRTTAPPIKEAIDYDLKLPAYQLLTLKNEVPVYMINAGAQDVVQIEFVFYAGNWYENQKTAAAAANSLLKNGTSTKNAFEINEVFDNYGAFCQTACYNETAVIQLSGLTKHIERLLPEVAALITDATYPEEELAIYKQNSKQRLSVNLQKSDFVASRLIDACLYGESHPYGTYTNATDLDALEVDSIRNFYKQYYSHGECVIFASGKLPANLEQLLNDIFGSLSLKKPSKHLPEKIMQPATEKKYNIINDANGVQGAIRIARPFVTRQHPDFTKLMLLNTLFGGYFGSRLMTNIREDKGYTYGINSYVQNHIHQSAWLIATDAGKEVCEATIAEVYKEMALLQTDLVDAEELALVRNYMAGLILGSLDGPFQIMAKWKNIILNDLDENYFYQSIKAIRETTAEELQQLAKKYFNKEDFFEMVVY